MSDSSGGVAPVHGGATGGPNDFMPSADVYWHGQGGGFLQEFKEGFADGANFSMAVMGAGLNAVTAGIQGRIRGTFG